MWPSAMISGGRTLTERTTMTSAARALAGDSGSHGS